MGLPSLHIFAPYVCIVPQIAIQLLRPNHGKWEYIAYDLQWNKCQQYIVIAKKRKRRKKRNRHLKMCSVNTIIMVQRTSNYDDSRWTFHLIWNIIEQNHDCAFVCFCEHRVLLQQQQQNTFSQAFWNMKYWKWLKWIILKVSRCRSIVVK